MAHPDTRVPPAPIAQIVATCSPLRVILFGSHARGDARPDSDLDLLVVPDDAPAEALHRRRRHEARRGHAGAVDIVPCRASDLVGRAHIRGSFAATVLREGLAVHERR